jgi:WD40 repeat protein
MNQLISCPKCKSENVVFSKKRGIHFCEDCEYEFTIESSISPLRIFLSYGHDHNEELVRLIKTDLEKRGHDVWFDKNEIKFGDEWRRSITDGILGSNRVLSFLSKYSTRDPGVCRDEIAIAIGVKGGNIQTILVESEQEVQPPVNIGHIQWLDMHDWLEKKAINEAEWGQWYQAKLAEIVKVVESDETRRFAGEIEKLNEYLKPIKSDARISGLLSKGFYGREWLFDTVENWRKDTTHDSRLFWIMGDPGVGKSAFAAQLTHTHGDTVIAAQFCEWDKPDHRDARRVVCSIAFQLATRLPDYRKFLLTLPEIAELDRKDASEIFDYLIANPLRSVINGGRERYLIVIDALDEAGESGKNPLVEMLARNAYHLPNWLGIIITSRPEESITGPLTGLNPIILETKTQSNRNDIYNYLQSRLALKLQNCSDKNALIKQIIERSEGVFFYIERFCDDVLSNNLSLDHPNKFPKGLSGIFTQYFKRQFPVLEKFRYEIRPILRIILAARNPLPIEIIKSTFNLEDEELRDLFRDMGSLFSLAFEEGVESIKPYHKSLFDWLSDHKESKVFYVSLTEGHKLLSNYGWVEYNTNKSFNTRYMLSCLPYHLIKANNWNKLASLLCDLDFVNEKCVKGMTYDLIKDYELAINEIPESIIIRKEENLHEQRRKMYVDNIITYSSKWNISREQNKNNQTDYNIVEKEIPLPEIIYSIKPLAIDTIERSIQSSIENPTNLTTIKAFSKFVNTECNNLLKYAHIEGFVYQLAYNYADSGIVSTQAENRIRKEKKTVYLLSQAKDRPRYNPYPALVKTLEGHKDMIWDVKISPDVKLAISAGNDGTIRIWELESGECIKILENNMGIIFSLCLGYDGKSAVAAGNNKCLYIWNIETNDCTIVPGHDATIQGIDQTPDSRIIISRGMDKRICIWDQNIRVPLRKYLNTFYLTSFCLTPNGRYIFTAGPDIRKYDSQTGELLQEIHMTAGYLSAIDITPDGRKIIAGSYDSTVLFWDLNENIHLKLLGHTKRIRSVKITPDAKIAVSTGDDKTIRIWEIDTGICIKVFQGHTDTVTSICISPDGKTAATVSFDKTLHIWDIQNGIDLNVGQFMSDNEYISIGLIQETDTSYLLDLLPGNIRKRIKDCLDRKNLVKLSLDGRTLITTGYDKLIRFWDIKTNQCIKIFSGHTAMINCISISNSGSYIATSDEDKTLRIWDLNSDYCVAVYQNFLKINSLYFTNDNSSIILIQENNQNKKLELINIDKRRPIITSIKCNQRKISDLLTNNKQYSFYSTCKSCNNNLNVDKNAVELIDRIANQVLTGKEKSLIQELPDSAWEIDQLKSECPHCHHLIKFNPFFINQFI